MLLRTLLTVVSLSPARMGAGAARAEETRIQTRTTVGANMVNMGGRRMRGRVQGFRT